MNIINPTMWSKKAEPTKCEEAVELNKQIVLMDSGRMVTQMGLFDDCIREPQMDYGLLEFINKTTMLPIGVDMGLCLPHICSTLEIEKTADSILANSTMTAGVITKYFKSPEEFHPKFGFAFYLTVTLLGIYVMCVLASTLVKALRKAQFVGAFNLHKSLQIFEYKEHKFNVFNGIRSFCMMWVILGHLYSVRIQNNVNELSVEGQVVGPFFVWVLASFFAVDVFFYIGGFLVAYSFLRNKMKSWIKYPLAIVHRILRFWPSYIMAMLIYYGIFIHTGSGPLWFKVQRAGQIDNCAAMWKPIIFVDNIVDNGESMCMGWGWYLQNDMQIFIASIPILFLYAKNRKIAFGTIGGLVLLSLIYNFVEVQVNEYITVAHRRDFKKWNSYFPNVYIKPWIRCPPYFFGLVLGLLYMEFIEQEKSPKQSKGFYMRIKEKFEASRKLKNASQLLGLAIIFFIIYIPRTLQVGYEWPQVVHSLYLTTTKLFFVMGVALLVTPSLLGIKNDMVFFIADTKFFHYIGKISFWTYLIHYMFVLHVSYTQRVDFYYDTRDIFSLYMPVAMLSMLFGALGTLLVEVPFAKIEQSLFKKNKGEGHKKNPLETKQPTMSLIDSVVSNDSVIQPLQNSTEMTNK